MQMNFVVGLPCERSKPKMKSESIDGTVLPKGELHRAAQARYKRQTDKVARGESLRREDMTSWPTV